MKAARYDLSIQIAGYDFYTWLCIVKAMGYEEIVFDARNIKTNKWPYPLNKQRYEAIIKPGPAFLDLPCREGTDGDSVMAAHMADGAKWIAKKNPWPRLKTVKPPGSERYTVTLRNTQRNQHRNSDEAVWREFAAEIGALVIEDYDVKPIHIYDRMALYAGAEMNFFVMNGPGILCVYSEYPCMIFDGSKVRDDFIRYGFGENYPQAIAGKHYLIWEDATAESIRRNYNEWKAGTLPTGIT